MSLHCYKLRISTESAISAYQKSKRKISKKTIFVKVKFIVK